MNLKQSPDRRNGRVYLSIVRGYRCKDTGKAKSEIIESLGYLDDLEKVYPDPIAFFKEKAKQMTEVEKAKRFITLSIDLNETLPLNYDASKNLGYAAILKLFHELDLHRFFSNQARNKPFKFNTASIMVLLVISRLLYPGSKKRAFEDKDRYFERFDFSLSDLYRSLAHFSDIAKNTVRHISSRVEEVYGRDTTVVYYDVTNYYFEIDEEDELRRRGVSKENRKDPVVQMGLLMDSNGIPISYELFAGNTVDTSTFRSVIGEVKLNHDVGRIIVVADRGIISGDNVFYLTGGEKRDKALNGYVFSYSVRGSDQEFKEFVLDPSGYHDLGGVSLSPDAEFMVKSRVRYRDVYVTMQNGSKRKKTVYEKQVVFWSLKHAQRAKREREKLLQRALALIANPAQYTRATSFGAAKYVRDVLFDKKSGEVVSSDKQSALDIEKIREEERFDGYYAIVTSERDMSEQEVIDTYRGLWEIEETFRITKGTLETRPVYVSTEESIQAHFLTCFIALVIIRLLQKETGKQYSADVLLDCLRSISCMHEQDNLYLLGYRSEVSDAIGRALGIDFTKRRMYQVEIKGLLAQSKKQSTEVKKRSRKRLV